MIGHNCFRPSGLENMGAGSSSRRALVRTCSTSPLVAPAAPRRYCARPCTAPIPRPAPIRRRAAMSLVEVMLALATAGFVLLGAVLLLDQLTTQSRYVARESVANNVE